MKRGDKSEEWGDAFTRERGVGLAGEPGRTPQGENPSELERPRDHEASSYQGEKC